MTRCNVEAAVELHNERIDSDILVNLIKSSHVRYIKDGFTIATSDGPIDVVRENGLLVCK